MHGIRLRLNWAQYHLHALKSAIDVYMWSEPYAVALEHDPVSGEGEVRVVVKSSPPESLSLILGDYVHNLRSVLDHIAWQLAISYRGSTDIKSSKIVSFPICGAEISAPGVPDWSSTAPRVLQDIDPAMWHVFRKFQPFETCKRWNTHEDHPLWLLNELWNFDKHRQLVFVLAHIYDSRIDMTCPEGEVEQRMIYTGPLKRETVIARFRVTPPGASVYFNGQQTFDIVLDKSGPVGERHAFNTLLDIDKFVREEVVPAFEPLL